MLAIFAVTCLAQVWIWDVTLRLDQAREQAGEVAVLRERLRFAGDLHDASRATSCRRSPSRRSWRRG